MEAGGLSTRSFASRLLGVRAVPCASMAQRHASLRLRRFHFSFADHWDPQRMNFGALRVINDDLVTPLNGFG